MINEASRNDARTPRLPAGRHRPRVIAPALAWGERESGDMPESDDAKRPPPHCVGSVYGFVPASWVHRDLLSAPELRVWLILCVHRNKTTGRCDPGVTLIAKETGIAYRHVREILNRLITKDAIKKDKRPGKTSTYTLLPPPIKQRAAKHATSADHTILRGEHL